MLLIDLVLVEILFVERNVVAVVDSVTSSFSLTYVPLCNDEEDLTLSRGPLLVLKILLLTGEMGLITHHSLGTLNFDLLRLLP